jgi:hypothetical protein
MRTIVAATILGACLIVSAFVVSGSAKADPAPYNWLQPAPTPIHVVIDPAPCNLSGPGGVWGRQAACDLVP